MKSSWLYLIFSLAMPVLLNGQLNFVEHIVDDNIHGTASVYVCDVDNDGDLDILGASMEENTIDWWRNDGGSPLQWTRLIIASYFIQAGSVFASDLDGDSLIDVIGAARVGDEIAWWDNDGGGNPATWTKYIISSGYDLAHEVYACDLDQDGDQDVLAAASDDNEITWWRNDGGSPVQWTEQAIDTTFGGAKSVHVADFDDDGDLDVVGAAMLDNDITWWRNDGGDPIEWTEFLIAGGFYYAHRVQAIDLDRDSLIDVLGAGYYANTIAWWRNNGGNPIYWTYHTIGTGFSGACIAQGIDLDGDADIDVVGTAQAGNQVAWWRNDGGSPIQWTKFVIDSLPRAWPLYCCDLDQDGDTDVVSGSSWAGTNEVKWYENQGSAVVEAEQEIQHPRISITPNPSTKGVEIKYNLLSASSVSIKIYDISGKLVKALQNGHQAPGTYTTYWDGTKNNNQALCGLYFCQMETNGWTSTTKFILLR